MNLKLPIKFFSINSLNDFSNYFYILQQNVNTHSVLFVKSCAHIQINLKRDFSYLCTGVDVNKFPIFEEIKEVFILKYRGYLIIEKQVDIYFDTKLSAFHVKDPKQNIFSIIEINKLYLLSIFEKLYVNEKWFIVPKHKIL